MKQKLPIGIALWLAGATALGAAQPLPQPEAFEALLRCRAVADSTARLACFDSASASLAAATASREVVVVDREQMRESRRTLFGLSIPNLSLFDGDKEEEEVKSIDGIVASAQRGGDGRWVMRLEDGATWRQTDDNILGRRPRKGSKVQVNRAAMGSYIMRVEGQPGIRVRRET